MRESKPLRRFIKIFSLFFVFSLFFFQLLISTQQVKADTWTPAQATNGGYSAVTWWKADAITGLNNADPVSSWLDSTTNGNNLSVVSGNTPTYRTNIINGLPAVRFDGTNDLLRTSNSFSVQTVIAVINYTENSTFTDYPAAISIASGTSAVGIIGTTLTTQLYIGSPAVRTYYVNGELGNELGTLSTFHIVTATQSGTFNNQYQIGQERTTVNRFWGGDIVEVVLYTELLSDTDRQQVENYLGTKYNITVSVTTPSAPTNLQDIPLNSSAKLSWVTPTSTGGSAITDYVIQYRVQGSSTWLTFNDGTSTASTATVTGLSNGITYEFQVAAINVMGTGTYSSTITSIPQAPGNLNVFIFAGQSNMHGADALIAGTGTQNLLDAGLQTQADKDTLFTFGYTSSFTLNYNTAEGPWGDIRGHLGTSLGVEGYYVHGPEVGFTRTLVDNGISNIAIIKGASNYNALENGKSAWVKGNSRYNSFATFINNRLQELTDYGYTYTIRGFVWHQGIDDAILHRTQPQYESDLTQIMSDFRGDYGTPCTPFILARSVNSTIAGTQYMAPIRTGQVSIADADPYAAWINVDDLTPYINTHHLSSSAQITAGERFANEWLTLTISAPSLSLTALSPDPNNDNTPSITGTATDTTGRVKNVQYQIDETSGSWNNCTADDGSFNEVSEAFTCTVSSALTDGNHTIYIRATDIDNNTTSDENASTDTFAIDATAPTISAVSSTPASTSSTITWTTNENTSSKADYGLTNSYGNSTSETDTSPRVTSHSVDLTSLVACTTYHYRVRSKDSALNEVIDSDNTFTTTGCTGSASVDSQTASNITTASGGSINLLSDSKGITLTVPASFAGSDANFQIKQLGKTATINTTSIPTGYLTIGSYIYDLKALSNISTLISTFDNTITVTITYGASDISGIGESSLKIYRWDGSNWNQLSGCSVNTSTKTVSCTTTAFSVFGFFGQASTSSSSSSTSTSSSSSTSTPSCGDQAPGVKAPWLYGAIAQDSGSVLLYFTEADNPVNKYVLEYGTKSDDYPYGVQDMGVNSRGQMTFLVKSLSPNTTYYFRVRGGNGCATGAWSNEISAKTKPIFSTGNLDIVSSELNTINNPTPTPTPTKKGTKTTETPKPTEFNGYDVKVKVVDIQNKPVAGAKVTLHSTPRDAVTDKNGIAAFQNVEAGDHKVLIAYDGYKGEQSINLTGDVKEFDLNVKVQREPFSLSPLAYGIIGVMGSVIIGLIVLIIKNKRKE